MNVPGEMVQLMLFLLAVCFSPVLCKNVYEQLKGTFDNNSKYGQLNFKYYEVKERYQPNDTYLDFSVVDGPMNDTYFGGPENYSHYYLEFEPLNASYYDDLGIPVHLNISYNDYLAVEGFNKSYYDDLAFESFNDAYQVDYNISYEPLDITYYELHLDYGPLTVTNYDVNLRHELRNDTFPYFEDGNVVDLNGYKSLRIVREDKYLDFIAAVDNCLGSMSYEEMLKCQPNEDEVDDENMPEECKCLGRCIMLKMEMMDAKNLIIRPRFLEMLLIYEPSTSQKQIDEILAAVDTCEKKPSKTTECGRPLELTRCVMAATGRSMSAFKNAEYVYGGA